MTETVEKKWYVIRGISGQENKIKDYIDSEVKRLNISEFVEEVIVPTQKVVQIRNGKKVSKEKVYLYPKNKISIENVTFAYPKIYEPSIKKISFTRGTT